MSGDSQEDTLASRRAAERKPFQWQWDLGAVDVDLKVIWEMPTETMRTSGPRLLAGCLLLLALACDADPGALPQPEITVETTRFDPGRTTRLAKSYKGPLFDVHIHLDPPDARRRDEKDILQLTLKALRKNGVVRALTMPTPNEGRFDDSEKGLERKRDLVARSEGQVNRLCLGHDLNVRIHLANQGFARADLEGRLAALAKELDSGECLGIGEIGPYHFEKRPGQAVLDYAMNHSAFLVAVGLAAERGLPVDLHAEPVQPDGSSREDEVFGGIALLFQRFPDLKLILAHTGMTNPTNALRLLERHPNLMMHFKAVTRHDRWRNLEPITDPDGNIFEDWAALFEAMPERFLVGSDAKFGRQRYNTRRYERDVNLLRGVLGTLNARAARLIAHDNAAVLYGGGALTESEGKGL